MNMNRFLGLLTKQQVIPKSYLKRSYKSNIFLDKTTSRLFKEKATQTKSIQFKSKGFEQLFPFILSKNFHMADLNMKEIGYKEFLKLKESGLTVIDVRDSNEIKASGTIPGSINIPLKQLGGALTKSPEKFKEQYGRSKPNESQCVMFLCQRGVRSKAAMDQAIQMGYKRATSFQGGWVTFSQNKNN